MTSPSAEEEAQATDDDLYWDGDVGTQVSAAGNSVSLRTCRDSASATCGTGWAYVTGVAGGGEVHGGLLGEASASPVNLHLQLLDDRYFVASESCTRAQAPSRAWLIDAVSGQAGVLSWRDEPTTLNSPEQKLLLCAESYSSLATYCAVVRGPDDRRRGMAVRARPKAACPRWSMFVTARSGHWRCPTAWWPVFPSRNTAPAGSGSGPTPTATGSASPTATTAARPGTRLRSLNRRRATSEELATSLVPYGDDLLEIAADGDRVAVAESWGGDNNTVYVSNDAGTSWTTSNLRTRRQRCTPVRARRRPAGA